MGSAPHGESSQKREAREFDTRCVKLCFILLTHRPGTNCAEKLDLKEKLPLHHTCSRHHASFPSSGVLAKDVCRLDGQCVENGSFDSNLILWQIVWREFFLRFGPQLTRLAISSCLLFGGILIFSGGMACTDSWASAARVSFLCLS
jgi:hypothetical protein